jgi:hypothetical protein
MTSPPWSHSISQSALTVTSATTNGCRSDVNTMGAVDVSPFGGFRQRSVLGPAVRVKYSMHCGRVNVGGRFNAVNDELWGGISTTIICFARYRYRQMVVTGIARGQLRDPLWLQQGRATVTKNSKNQDIYRRSVNRKILRGILHRNAGRKRLLKAAIYIADWGTAERAAGGLKLLAIAIEPQGGRCLYRIGSGGQLDEGASGLARLSFLFPSRSLPLRAPCRQQRARGNSTGLWGITQQLKNAAVLVRHAIGVGDDGAQPELKQATTT